MPEFVDRKSAALSVPPVTATSAEFVDVPKTPKTNPATATAATKVTATMSTVATMGEMALLPRTRAAADAVAQWGVLKGLHALAGSYVAVRTRTRASRPQLLSLRLRCLHPPSRAFSRPKASLISPGLKISRLTSVLKISEFPVHLWGVFHRANAPRPAGASLPQTSDPPLRQDRPFSPLEQDSRIPISRKMLKGVLCIIIRCLVETPFL